MKILIKMELQFTLTQLSNMFHPVQSPKSIPFTMIARKHYNLKTAVANFQTNMERLTNWYNKWKLTLNSTKTEVKMFTLRTRYT